jgi:hypothetical protein
MRNLLGLLLSVILVLFHHAIRAEPHGALFCVPAFGTEKDLPPANSRIALRQRLVTVRSGILDRGGEPTLHLNLFDDIRLEADWKRTERKSMKEGCVSAGEVFLLISRLKYSSRSSKISRTISKGFLERFGVPLQIFRPVSHLPVFLFQPVDLVRVSFFSYFAESSALSA